MTTKDTQFNFKAHNCHDLQMTRLSISRDECFDGESWWIFYLSLTKQNMTCHYFDFFLQKSAAPETDITFSDKSYNSPQWDIQFYFCQNITQTSVVEMRLGWTPLFPADAALQARSHLSRLMRLPCHRKTCNILVFSPQIKSPQTCNPNNFWISSWHKDSSFSLELLASSIWGFTTSVGWVEAALYRLYHRWHHVVMRSWLPNIRGASPILRHGLQGNTVAIVMRHSVLTVESQ